LKQSFRLSFGASSEYAVLSFGYRKDAPFFILSSTTFGYSSYEEVANGFKAMGGDVSDFRIG
jgi:hypothetical protein